MNVQNCKGVNQACEMREEQLIDKMIGVGIKKAHAMQMIPL